METDAFHFQWIQDLDVKGHLNSPESLRTKGRQGCLSEEHKPLKAYTEEPWLLGRRHRESGTAISYLRHKAGSYRY